MRAAETRNIHASVESTKPLDCVLDPGIDGAAGPDVDSSNDVSFTVSPE
jgi:hypothetical protein